MVLPVTLKIHEREIAQELSRENDNTNSAIFADIEKRAQEKLASANAETVRIQSKLDQLVIDKKAITDRTPRGADDPAIVDLRAELALHKKNYADAVAQTNAFQTDTIAEKNGVKLHENNSGIKGEGDRYATYKALEQSALDVAAREKSAISNTEDAISKSTAESNLAGERFAANTSNRIAEIEKSVASEEDRLHAALAEQNLLRDHRIDWINQQAEADPSFVPPSKGLISQMEALSRIVAQKPSALLWVLGIKALVMALEMAGPLIAWFFVKPGIYCMRVALRLRDETEFEAERRQIWSEDRQYRHDLHKERISKRRTKEKVRDWYRSTLYDDLDDDEFQPARKGE